jgi:TetR/AcrR family transcriptional repressor of nem operon
MLVMMKNTKETLLEAGCSSFLKKGYNGVGLNEILKMADVPKGSFYHYFDTKETFLIEALSFYLKKNADVMFPFISDTSKPALDRFRDYIECNLIRFDEADCSGGCLIGNMAQEMSDASTPVREKIQLCLNVWCEGIEVFFIQAQKEGNLCSKHDTSELANMFVDGLQGALLRMKVEQSVEPLQRFLNTYLKILSMEGDAR